MHEASAVVLHSLYQLWVCQVPYMEPLQELFAPTFEFQRTELLDFYKAFDSAIQTAGSSGDVKSEGNSNNITTKIWTRFL